MVLSISVTQISISHKAHTITHASHADNIKAETETIQGVKADTIHALYLYGIYTETVKAECGKRKARQTESEKGKAKAKTKEQNRTRKAHTELFN